MYGRILRSFSPAAFVYVIFCTALAAVTFKLFLLFADPASVAQRALLGVAFLVAVTAAAKVLVGELWVQLVEAARADLASTGGKRSWLPSSDWAVLRLERRYRHADEATQEVFRTLLSDALSEGSTPDGPRLLDSATALTAEGPR